MESGAGGRPPDDPAEREPARRSTAAVATTPSAKKPRRADDPSVPAGVDPGAACRLAATRTCRLATTTNQKDDWLHRGDALDSLGLYAYSRFVTRADMPAGMHPADLSPPRYAWTSDYALYRSHCQIMDPIARPPTVPVVDRPRCPSPDRPSVRAEQQEVLPADEGSVDGRHSDALTARVLAKVAWSGYVSRTALGTLGAVAPTMGEEVMEVRARHGGGPICGFTDVLSCGRRGVPVAIARDIVRTLNHRARRVDSQGAVAQVLGVGGCRECRETVAALWAIAGTGLWWRPAGRGAPRGVYFDQTRQLRYAPPAVLCPDQSATPEDVGEGGITHYAEATVRLLQAAPGLREMYIQAAQAFAVVRGGAALTCLSSARVPYGDVDIFLRTCQLVATFGDSARIWKPVARMMGRNVEITGRGRGVLDIAVTHPLEGRRVLQFIADDFGSRSPGSDDESDDGSEETMAGSTDGGGGRDGTEARDRNWMTFIGGRGAAFDIGVCNTAAHLGEKPTRMWTASPAALGGILLGSTYVFKSCTRQERLDKYGDKGFPVAVGKKCTMWTLSDEGERLPRGAVPGAFAATQLFFHLVGARRVGARLPRK